MQNTAQPLVSFVVPSYNYGRYLPDCLNSIFGQQGSYPIEVIVIDDASTDNSLEVLAQYQSDSRLRVLVHETNQGHVKTVNEGLALARGEFVARIDPDDRYHSDFLTTLLPKFENPETGLVYGDAAIMDSAGSITTPSSDSVHNGRDYKGDELPGLLRSNYICAPTAIARRTAWHEAMPIPAHLAFNDWYFNLMMARRHEFHYVNRVVADYRVHAANHHVKIIANKSEEPSIRHVLDYIFAETEATPAQEARKQALKGRAYAAQYLTLALKYFGHGMMPDARRCFFEALRWSPSESLSFRNLRLLAATWLDPETYSALKRLVRPASRPSA